MWVPQYHAISVNHYLEDFQPSARPYQLVKEQSGMGFDTAYIRMDHVLEGNVTTYKGGISKASGGHYLRNPNLKIDNVLSAKDSSGVFEANISIRHPETGKWVKKTADTSIFPEEWSKRRVAQEIEGAFRNSEPVIQETVSGKTVVKIWRGESPSGLEIEGYYGKPDGSAATAWPVYKGNKAK